MENIIIYLGPGVVTYLVKNYITKRETESYFKAVMEIIAYSFTDIVCLLLLLSPLGRIYTSNTEYGFFIDQGETSVIASFVIAVVLGILFSCKNFRFKIEKCVIENKEQTSNEE